MIHEKESPLKGKPVHLFSWVRHPQFKDFASKEIVVEDWWDRVYGSSWKFAQGNPACLVYAVRTGFSATPIPNDDEVLYGHSEDGLGHLIHVTEIKNVATPEKR
jgi:hypothetical protein